MDTNLQKQLGLGWEEKYLITYDFPDEDLDTLCITIGKLIKLSDDQTILKKIEDCISNKRVFDSELDCLKFQNNEYFNVVYPVVLKTR